MRVAEGEGEPLSARDALAIIEDQRVWAAVAVIAVANALGGGAGFAVATWRYAQIRNQALE